MFLLYSKVDDLYKNSLNYDIYEFEVTGNDKIIILNMYEDNMIDKKNIRFPSIDKTSKIYVKLWNIHKFQFYYKVKYHLLISRKTFTKLPIIETYWHYPQIPNYIKIEIRPLKEGTLESFIGIPDKSNIELKYAMEIEANSNLDVDLEVESGLSESSEYIYSDEDLEHQEIPDGEISEYEFDTGMNIKPDSMVIFDDNVNPEIDMEFDTIPDFKLEYKKGLETSFVDL